MKTLVLTLLFALGTLSAFAQTQFIKPDGLAPANGYTHVVVAKPGSLVFIAGQVATDKDGKIVGKDDLKAQATQVFANLKTALTAAGATFDDVVKITWYVKAYKPDMLPILRDVRSIYVNKEKPPASTLVGVVALAQDDHLLEVEAIAVIPEKASPKK